MSRRRVARAPRSVLYFDRVRVGLRRDVVRLRVPFAVAAVAAVASSVTAVAAVTAVAPTLAASPKLTVK